MPLGALREWTVRGGRAGAQLRRGGHLSGAAEVHSAAGHAHVPAGARAGLHGRWAVQQPVTARTASACGMTASATATTSAAQPSQCHTNKVCLLPDGQQCTANEVCISGLLPGGKCQTGSGAPAARRAPTRLFCIQGDGAQPVRSFPRVNEEIIRRGVMPIRASGSRSASPSASPRPCPLPSPSPWCSSWWSSPRRPVRAGRGAGRDGRHPGEPLTDDAGGAGPVARAPHQAPPREGRGAEGRLPLRQRCAERGARARLAACSSRRRARGPARWSWCAWARGRVGFAFTPKSKPALPLSVDNLTSARKLDVTKEGAELVVTCAAGGGQRCQVRLQ